MTGRKRLSASVPCPVALAIITAPLAHADDTPPPHPPPAAAPAVPCVNILPPDVMAQTPWRWHVTPCPGA
jgi:hypothetical protein